MIIQNNITNCTMEGEVIGDTFSGKITENPDNNKFTPVGLVVTLKIEYVKKSIHYKIIIE